MIKKIESIPEYVLSSHYRSIGIPIVTLIREYDVNENCFGWKWKTTLYTENDDILLWECQFKWFEIPFCNYEFGLTENEMNEIISQMRELYDIRPYLAEANASEFEKLIFNATDGHREERFAANATIKDLGKWKACRILSNDAFSNNVANELLLEKLYCCASDAAAKMLIFKSAYNTESGVSQTLRFAFNEEDYKQYMIFKYDHEGGNNNG